MDQVDWEVYGGNLSSVLPDEYSKFHAGLVIVGVALSVLCV